MDFFVDASLVAPGGFTSRSPLAPLSYEIRSLSIFFDRTQSKRNDRFFLTKCFENVLWFLRLAGMKKLDDRDDDKKVGIEENYYDLGFPI